MKIVRPKTVPPPPEPLTATAAPPARSSAPQSVRPAQTGSAQTGGPARAASPAQRPTSDSFGAKVEHDPLVRLRDSMIQTSAHQSHPTAASAADGFGKLGKGLAYLTMAKTVVQIHSGFAQDGNTLGVHTTRALGRAAVSAVGGAAGAVIGAGVGEAAGAFIGGAFFGFGAVPGAAVGGVIGEMIGNTVGSNMASDDLNSLKTAAVKFHA